MNQTAFTLINPQTKALAFKFFAFEDASYFKEQKNYQYYSIILVTKGKGSVRVDGAEYSFGPAFLMCFSVYQPFRIVSDGECQGILLHFHPDFFCIHKHQREIACDGVLFNNMYDSPVVRLENDQLLSLTATAMELKTEMQNAAIAQYELLISYLKIFLINASRIKLHQHPSATGDEKKEPFVLRTLKDAIEEHYKTKHSAGDYADLLNISVRALNRLSKVRFNKTLTSLIAERIIIEAKRELYLSAKPVKAIAFELGFSDEFYFSRFFKRNAAVSPQIYRETVGFSRGEHV